jgi:hypothetical protein
MTDSPWAALATGEHVDQPLLPEQHRDRRRQQARLQEAEGDAAIPHCHWLSLAVIP